MNSICKPYPFNKNYMVYDDGRVYSIKSKKFLKPFKSKNFQYLRIDIYVEGVRKQIPIHRIVAETFIKNEYNKPEVNHIDGDKLNNSVKNLEWVTHQENMNHAYYAGLSCKKNIDRSLKVAMYSRDGELLATYNSAIEAEKWTGVCNKHIGSVCNGNRKSAGGFVWAHVRD